ncbi:hypothetical protein V8E55_008559 [Tylopilus felleus]
MSDTRSSLPQDSLPFVGQGCILYHFCYALLAYNRSKGPCVEAAIFYLQGQNATQLTQTCGGHIDAITLVPSPYLHSNGTPSSITKGYICPLGQVCQEGENPFTGVDSFDTVYYATLQIVVLASANTWSQVMYQIMASEYWVASIFFILGILVLNLWLFNLLVAVITNSFSAIRSGTKKVHLEQHHSGPS